MQLYRFSNWCLAMMVLAVMLGLSACVEIDNSATGTTPSSSAPETGSSGETIISGDSTSGSPTTSSVTLLLTDAPSDEFSEINITVRKVDLLASDGGEVEIFNGLTTINLLGLRTYSNLFAARNNVPPGLYRKIRMYMDDVELVRRDDETGEVTERIHPKLVANGKLDLNPRTEFFLAPGKSITIQLDMDAKKSIHFGRGGKGHHDGHGSDHDKDHDKDHGEGKHGDSDHEGHEYMFRPVVFIDIVDMANFGGKLVRVDGDVTTIDRVNNNLELCGVDTVYSNGCVTVEANEGTSVFDSDGQLSSISNVFSQVPGVAIGRLKTVNGKTVMTPEIIELGPKSGFWYVRGDVTTAPVDDTNIFYFGIAPGQGFIAGTEFRVAPLMGAKLFSQDGVELDWSAIAVGKIVGVEGILKRTAILPFTMKATIVYLDMTQSTSQLTGILSNINFDNYSFNVTTTDVGDRCAVATQTANVYQVSGNATDGYSGGRISFNQLQDGQLVDLYGDFNSSGCYAANDILVNAN